MKIDMVFPEVFITGRINNERDNRAHCADIMVGWACCMCGSKPPQQFGEGMIKLGKKLGITATADNAEAYAVNKGWI